MEFEESHPDGTPKEAPLTQEQMQSSFQPMLYTGSTITLPKSSYRVYSAVGEFKEVEAESAYEAMQKTEIRTPVKIERHSISRMAVLTQDIIDRGAKEATIETAPAATEEAAIEPAPAAEVEIPTEEEAQTRGLEGDEVEALLKKDD